MNVRGHLCALYVLASVIRPCHIFIYDPLRTQQTGHPASQSGDVRTSGVVGKSHRTILVSFLEKYSCVGSSH